VILGCTELCLLLDAGDVAAPLFDTTSLHAHAALDAVDVPVRPGSPDADG
jgi:aspartate racemase